MKSKAKQAGMIVLFAELIALLVWGGAVGYSVVNAEQHPEVSKFGRQ